ncbi:hypothetical protein CVT24_006144 [Panaeolus cyanescens]|uniref:DUF6699 domain-containing protein n=1 Tax=Panaeolus cyanescens TaxID=181874 RepID=A0A409VZY4_9AGAR|nr:hypothetical protein CVT24_006144 [Panaeolus cyanescens]
MFCILELLCSSPSLRIFTRAEHSFCFNWTLSDGPILSQTDLYLLQTDLELNPILEGKAENQLQFHLVTGFTTSVARGGPSEASLIGKDEPATLPRVNQLIIISRQSPWCTIVKKDTGVTIGDVCSTIYKEYTENDITDPEFHSLNSRSQEQIRRMAAHNASQSGQAPQWGYYPPQSQPERLRRVDWLRDKVYFEGLSKDPSYAKQRLGFQAPNILVMELTS